MENFNYKLPTDIYFGKEQIKNLKDIIGQPSQRILLIYGKGSIKKNNLYDEIITLLSNHQIFELSGVESNPKLASVNEGIQICKEERIDLVLAVGGGSVIDCAKVVAAGACYEGDVWDLVTLKAEITKALSIHVVVTTAAAGSETGPGAVISNPETNEKRGVDSSLLLPKTAILDPEYTFTVSASNTAIGSVDIFSHLIEQYFVTNTTYLTDQFCEAAMRTVIKYTPIAMTDPNHYEARGQLLWSNTLANNGVLSLGNELNAFSSHGIEHELSAFYDVIHAVGLAIILPHWMRYILSEATIDRFVRYGIEVWQIDPSLDKTSIANQAIDATEGFFKNLNIPTSLSELEIDDQHFEEMAKQAVQNGYLEYAWVPLDEQDVMKILKNSL
jgi:hypothetical protein